MQRWHAYHGLPVYHLGGARGSVFAYTDEIDRWLVSLAEENRSAPAAEDEEFEACKGKSLELTARANELWEMRSERNVQTISSLYRSAIEEFPANAAALNGLANTMIFGAVHGVMNGAVAYPRAQEALRRLPKPAAESLETRCTAAWLSLLYERDWRRARVGFEEVLDKQPWSSFAMSGLSMLYVWEGRFREASECAWAAWRRNPLACTPGALLCWVSYVSGDLEQALDLLAQVRAGGGYGTIAAVVEALSLIQTGSPEIDLERIRSLVEECPECPTLRGALGYAYAVSGKATAAWEILSTLERMSEMKKRNNGYGLALVLLGLNRWEDAVKWLEISYTEGALWSLAFGSDPILRPLAGELNFDLLLRRAAAGRDNLIQTDPSQFHAATQQSTSLEAV